MKKSLISFAVALCALSANGATVNGGDVQREIPSEWDNLVEGGCFMDRILPMPQGKLSMKSWGSLNVQPRYVDNGMEDNVISYWGGNILKGDDGKYHFFLSGWPEDNPRGHMGWYDASNVYHVVGDNTIGPFKMVETIGHGHNTEAHRLKDGSYMVYAIGGRGDKESHDCIYYSSKTINGPWEKHELPWDLRGRTRSDGVGGTGDKNWYHNMTFAPREDGSMLMINRGGKTFISKEGNSAYNLITDDSAYPYVNGRYEDPLVWRDNVQYNMIVNDWYGRTAFYLRSKDGVNWIQDPGQAYIPGVSKHADGRVEDWYKYERVRVCQDEFGRAVQINFAVIDTLKNEDLPNDNHSSKNIGMPLNKGMLLEVLNKEPFTRKTKEIKVRIIGEEGFKPAIDLDVESLKFGVSSEVNFGRGAKVLSSEKSGKDLIVTFEGMNHCITDGEFAPKMIGKKKNGEMVFGFSRLPWVNYKPAILSALTPVVKGKKVSVEVENFGLSTSNTALLTLWAYDEYGLKIQVGSATVPSIDSYCKTKVSLDMSVDGSTLKGKPVVVMISDGVEVPSRFRVTLAK